MADEYEIDASYDEGAADTDNPRQPDSAEIKLSGRICERIRKDKQHHKKAFERMRRDTRIARRGAPDDWPEDHYVANITGRHINHKTAALYAKNPKAVARRRQRLDFRVWDETQESLLMAMQIAEAAMQTGMDPMSGMPAALSPQVMQAMELLQDYQEGMASRQRIERVGKTLEILFDYFTKEQKPLDFKSSMKQLVRRASTTGVGFVKLGFQREYGQDPDVSARLADVRAQIQHIERLSEEAEKQGDRFDEGHRRELELSLQSLQQQEYVLLREGLVFDFPESTRVIPDCMCRSLNGFVGARWVTVEFLYTPEEVKETFGIDIGKSYKAYTPDGMSRDNMDQAELDFGEDSGNYKGELVCVWEHYDRKAGLVYYVCDGYRGFLREPSAPDIYVEDFWPVYALTFNEVEDPDNVFPPSDVTLMLDMQNEYNRARQGQREHRKVARPRFVTPTGVLSDDDKEKLRQAQPFDVLDLSVENGTDMRTVLQPVPTPGVDPNLYEVNGIFTDIQIVVGSQEAQFGGVAKATATESSIAESSRISSVGSNVDDLDTFLSNVARAAGQILLREMSAERVAEIAGPGAVWPQLTLEELASEVFLEIEAGSSGKPNQAQEIRNWKEMLPFILQMPNIQPTWLARETLRRLDDRMDLTDALAQSTPAIVAMNRMSQPSPADPSAAPDMQGDQGANNGPAAPGGATGTGAAMGNNQV